MHFIGKKKVKNLFTIYVSVFYWFRVSDVDQNEQANERKKT
jgi:hypothetical protein